MHQLLLMHLSVLQLAEQTVMYLYYQNVYTPFSLSTYGFWGSTFLKSGFGEDQEIGHFSTGILIASVGITQILEETLN